MARPLTAQQQIDALRAEGLTVREYPGWRDRGLSRARSRGHDVNGIVIHTTAGGVGSRGVESYIRDILVQDRLVPDKCNVAIDPDGVVWMVTAGRANHMLYYSQRARDMSIAGSWPTTGGSVNARGSLQNGNAWTYGVECIAPRTPNDKQREAAVKWAAALCRAHGWEGREVFGHGEAAYDRGHADPGWDMSEFRADVVARLQRKDRATVTNPVPGSWISAVYGQRPKNRTYWQAKGFHTGRDYAASEGAPVLAVTDGTVTVRDDAVLGCISILSGDNGRHYWYCHLQRGSRDPYRGERVKAGQQIGRVGQTGTGASGPHLHLEDSSSRTSWGVGLRDPQWPLPDNPPATADRPAAPKAATTTAPAKDDDMPEMTTVRAKFTHSNPGKYRLPPDSQMAVPARQNPMMIQAYARVTVPEGVTVTTRWVSWDSREKRWVRYDEEEGCKNYIQIKQAWGGADLRLDVLVDKPCEVSAVQSATIWEA